MRVVAKCQACGRPTHLQEMGPLAKRFNRIAHVCLEQRVRLTVIPP